MDGALALCFEELDEALLSHFHPDLPIALIEPGSAEREDRLEGGKEFRGDEVADLNVGHGGSFHRRLVRRTVVTPQKIPSP